MSSSGGLRAWVEIDLDALAHNIQFLRQQYIGADVMAIVKADAYGHGVDLIAPAAYANGLRHFGVATTEEGLYLRRLLRNDAYVYVLSPVAPSEAPAIVADRLIPVISSVEMARALSEAAVERNADVEVHVDVDTGMGRSGFGLDEIHAELARIEALPGLSVTGAFTHFASADENPADAREQHRLFVDFLNSLGSRASALTIHAGNSPASLVLGNAVCHTLLRPGLLLYGIEPSPGMLRDFDLRPVMSVKARVTLRRDLPAGSTISYGKTYTVPDGGGRYATVAIGYGDGFPRPLGNVGHVLLHGRRAPIRGRVCMDQLVVDIAGIDDVRPGDVATLIGRDHDLEISVGDIADLIRTTPHLIPTCLLPRLPRISVSARR